jgi:hypothetical protein
MSLRVCPYESLVLSITLSAVFLGTLDAAYDFAVFKVQSSVFRVQGSRFRVQGSEFKVQGSEIKVQGSEFKVQG